MLLKLKYSIFKSIFIFNIFFVYTKVSQSLTPFWFVLFCSAYITWPNQFKQWKVLAMVGSIVVVGALSRFSLLHSMRDLKVAQMNVQRCLIREFVLYELELESNTAEANKNIWKVNTLIAIDLIRIWLTWFTDLLVSSIHGWIRKGTQLRLVTVHHPRWLKFCINS